MAMAKVTAAQGKEEYRGVPIFSDRILSVLSYSIYISGPAGVVRIFVNSWRKRKGAAEL